MSNITFQVIGLVIQRSVFGVYAVIHVKLNHFLKIRSYFSLPVTNFS